MHGVLQSDLTSILPCIPSLRECMLNSLLGPLHLQLQGSTYAASGPRSLKLESIAQCNIRLSLFWMPHSHHIPLSSFLAPCFRLLFGSAPYSISTTVHANLPKTYAVALQRPRSDLYWLVSIVQGSVVRLAIPNASSSSGVDRTVL